MTQHLDPDETASDQGGVPETPADSGVTSAESDREAAYDDDDSDDTDLSDNLPGAGVLPDTGGPSESHQADIDAGYDDDREADDPNRV